MYRRPLGACGACGDVGGEPAGEISGIATLSHDLRQLGAELSAQFGPITPSRVQYESVLRRLPSLQPGDRLTGAEMGQFIGGTIGRLADAIVLAQSLSLANVEGPQQRSENQARQAAIIDPARLLWQTANDMLANMLPQGEQAGAAGLGFAPVVWAAMILGGAILVSTIVVSVTYYIDTGRRLDFAVREARAICVRSRPPCTPQQEADLIARLSLGPLDRFAAAFGKEVGKDLVPAVIAVAVGGAVLGGGLIWWYGLGGQSWAVRKFTRRSR